ncbi:protein 5NUC-like [Ornithodoros turicata]|uniref:protein 5NUC-like n=1 Tax=Ornithodoros turicata TaxID=34597 RepID=UPI00313A0D16
MGNEYSASKYKSAVTVQLNDTGKPTIFLNAGNMFRGNIWFNLLGPTVWSAVLNVMHFDAITLNYKEFYRGPPPLKLFFDNLSISDVPVVCCNMDFAPESLLTNVTIKKSLMIRRGGVNIGIIGYFDPRARIRAAPGPTVITDDPVECIKEQVKELRARGSQIFIAFGGYTLDLDTEIARSIPELSVVVTATESVRMYPKRLTPPAGENATDDYPMTVTRSDGTLCLMVAVFPFGKYLGNITVTYDRQTWRPIAYEGLPAILSGESFLSGTVADVLRQWDKYVTEQSRLVVGTTKVQIKNTFSDCSLGQCNGGTLLAEAAFDYFSNEQAEGTWSMINAAVVNAAATHSGVDERLHGGEIQKQDLYNLYPFEDQFVLMTMQGNTVFKMMQHSVDETGYGGQFLQMSGLRVVYAGRRVEDLRIVCTSCRTVKFEKVFRLQWYTIAMPQYIAEGGEGFDFSAVPKSLRMYTNVTDVYLLAQYVKKFSPIKTGIDGRIRILASGAPHTGTSIVMFVIVFSVTSIRR